MMMCSRCKKRPAVVFISSMQGTERRNEGLCLRCAKEMGLPQVDEYLKQMGISEEDFENAYDSMFDENGNPDQELLKNIGFEDITNGFKPHDSDTDDDDSEDDVDDSDDPDKKDELFQKGGANSMPEFFKKMFEPFEGALSKDDMDKLNEEAKAKSRRKSRKRPTRSAELLKHSAQTSPAVQRTVKSTALSAGTRRSAELSRYFPAGLRTIPALSANQASERPPLPRVSR